jgi:rSAM/selenodomain-associated transferase 2
MPASISIVIPVLDEAARIVRHLAVLAPLRATGAEVLVVDGGSTDDTVELAAPLADVVLCAPRGRASQMNAGARAARGELLVFLHADTTLPPAALAVIRGALEGGRAWGRFDVRIEGRSPLLRMVAWFMNHRSRLTGIATGDQAIFVRRDVFEALGGFPVLPLMEDVALSRELRRLGQPACLRDRVVTSGRRWDDRGVLRTIGLMWLLRAGYWFGVDLARLARRYA